MEKCRLGHPVQKLCKIFKKEWVWMCIFFFSIFFSILIFFVSSPCFYITSTQNVYNETSNSCLNFFEKFLNFENFLTNFFRGIMWVFWNFCVDWKTVFGRTWFLEFFRLLHFFIVHCILNGKCVILDFSKVDEENFTKFPTTEY